MLKKQKTSDTFYAIDISKDNKIVVIDRKQLKEMITIELPKVDYYPVPGNKMSISKRIEKTEIKRYVILYDEDLLPPDRLYKGQELTTFGFENDYKVIIDKDGDYSIISTDFFDDPYDDMYMMHMLDDDIEGE
jgi:hypothetical protein